MYATVQELVDALTPEEKIGQLFIIRPDALDLTLPQETINDAKADGVTMLTDAMRETLQTYPVGGICQFGKNITDPEQLAQFNADLQAASRTPLFIAVDEEGGAVAGRVPAGAAVQAVRVVRSSAGRSRRFIGDTAFRVRVSGVANGAGGYGIRPYEGWVTGIDPGTSANGRLAGEQCSPL